MADVSMLTPYVPRLLPEIARGTKGPVHKVIDGTLVFADLSGFTALSERLASLGGKAGAEEMTSALNAVFGELLDLAAHQGGEMLKYGGDAALLLFRGDGHASRAVVAASHMQRGLRRVGKITTDFGSVRLRMSVGVHSGPIDCFLVGPHRELVVAGPVPTHTAAMETAADAGEILLSLDTASLLPRSCLGERKGDGVLLARQPRASATPGVVARGDADLSRFIPKALRTTLAAGPIQAEHRPAAIGFLMVGFDDTSLLAELHETFTRVEEILQTFDVTFLATDLAGGGVKIITAAGLPVAQPDAEDRMLRAARAIVEAELPLPVRFGVQRGHVFAGTVGPSYRMAFTVIGDVVNTAARLVARAGLGEVLTLAPVLEQSTAEFVVDEMAPFVAKGKAEPLLPLRVGSLVGRRRRHEEVLPLVGRSAQVAAFDAALDALRRREAGVLDVVGDAGMGKSRLVDELVTHAADLTVVRAEAHALDAGRAYGVAESLLRPLLNAETLPALRRRVRDHAPDLVDWIPLLGVPFGFAVKPNATTSRIAAPAVPAKIREVTVALVTACVHAPTALIVEDLHWCDAPSARVLQALAAASSATPLLLVTTRRPAEGGLTVPGTAVEVAELSHLDAGAMLDRLVATPLLPDRRAAMVTRSGGNPMFLRELAVSLAAGDTDELPDRIESLVEARIDRLDLQDRIVLRAAAVLGDDFSLDELSAALEQPVSALALDRLSGFIVQGHRARFRHALLRDSAYAGLPFRWRRVIHGRIGSYLESRPNPDANVERLAVHFASAGDKPKAWRYGAAAGDKARSRYAYAEAAAFYDTALSATTESVSADERFRVIDSYAYCLQTAGDLGRALEVADRGRRLVRGNAEHRARLYLHTATSQLNLGRVDEADRATRSGLRLTRATAAHSASHVRLLVHLARIEQARGRNEPARRSAMQAASLATQSGDKPALAHALAAQFGIETNMRVAGRNRIGEKARRLYTSLGQDADAAVVLNLLAIDLDHSGLLPEAIAAYGDAQQLQQSAGLQLHAAVSGYNQAGVFVKQGRTEEPQPILERCLNIFAASNYVAGVLAARIQGALIQSLQGNHDEAVTVLREVMATYRSAGLIDNVADVGLHLAQVELLRGEVAAARKSLPPVAAAATAEYAVHCLLTHAVIAAQRGRPRNEVRKLLAAAEADAVQRELAYLRATEQVVRAHLFPENAADGVEGQMALDSMGVVRIPLLEALATT